MKKLTEKEVIDLFKENNAYWVHSGNPKDPHVELTNGYCSNAYFNCSSLLRFPIINEILAECICSKLKEAGIEDNYPEWVVGSSYAAITISYEVARKLGTEYAFAEKSDIPKEFTFKRWTIPKGAIVLQIEELITSLQTAVAVRRSIENDNQYGVKFLPLIGTIVFRPSSFSNKYCIGKEEVKIVSLFQKEVWAVPQKRCPLCKNGSFRYRPKHNWSMLK